MLNLAALLLCAVALLFFPLKTASVLGGALALFTREKITTGFFALAVLLALTQAYVAMWLGNGDFGKLVELYWLFDTGWIALAVRIEEEIKAVLPVHLKRYYLISSAGLRFLKKRMEQVQLAAKAKGKKINLSMLLSLLLAYAFQLTLFLHSRHRCFHSHPPVHHFDS